MRDAYTDRLTDFGYDRGLLPTSRLTVGVRYRLSPHIQLGGAVGMTSSPTWERDTVTGSAPLRFSWSTITFAAMARLDHTPFRGRSRVFVQAGAGLGVGRTKLTDERDEEFTETSTGIVLTGSAGVEWTTPWWRGVGIGLAYTFQFAPVIKNLTGDRHLGVGNFVELTWQYRF
jgi:hypothetical protein